MNFRAANSLKQISLSLLFVLAGFLPAGAYTADDATTIMDAYNKAFYIRTDSSSHYADSETGGITYFWEQAEEIEGLIDAYDRTQDPEYKKKMSDLLYGFVETNGKDWSKNIFNDDIMWACIAYLRAYLDTGNEWFLSVAKSNFSRVYARAWDDQLGGGLWWTTENQTKNACVNGPGAIAAYLLYLGTGDSNYLDKATAIYDWERKNLFQESNGQIYDGMNAKGVLATFPTTYNQGTFVGAANYLGKINDARLAANFAMNNMGDVNEKGVRIMPEYGINGNNSGFNGIEVRWIAKFMTDQSLQSTYLPWLQANAEAAWTLRRERDNLSWCQWRQQTPDDQKFHSWDCSSSVVILQVTPPPK
jgi:predicted alpha-1,6-mannanase (GH76 family)